MLDQEISILYRFKERVIMHDYMIKNAVRRKVNELLICGYLIIAFVMKSFVENNLEAKLTVPISSDSLLLLEMILSIVLPGISVGLVYWLYDKWGWRWKWVKRLHKVPDLNGQWKATVESKLKNGRKPVIEMTIRQTWNKIQIYGQSEKGTETISNLVMVMEINGGISLGYSYWIHHKNEPSYPGFNILRYENGKLYGDYYSNKDVTRDFEEIFKGMQEEEANILQSKLKGCGSKGYILWEKI